VSKRPGQAFGNEKFKRMKKVIIAVVVLALAGCALYLWKGRKKETQAEQPKESIVKVERGPIRLAVACTGRVVPNLDVDIKCKASGEIITLPFDVSDPIKKGELVVELDPVDEERRVHQAEVTLSVSEARLDQAKLNLQVAELNLKTERLRADADLDSAKARAGDSAAKAERLKQLLEKKLAAQEDYDTALTSSVQAQADLENAEARVEDLKTQEIALDLKREDIKLAESQVESNKIDLALAKQRLEDTKVFSPIDGVVSVRDVQIGQIVASGVSNVGGGTTLLTISDLSHIYVLASVDESDIGKVEVDQGATITADAFPGVPFMGKVVRIATRGVNSSNVVTFEVKIEVLGPRKTLLKPEMTANVEVVAGESDNALLVPADAVSRKQRARIALVKSPDGTTEEREVEVGISDGVNIEVLKGLDEGEEVVVRKDLADSRWRNAPGGFRMGPGMMMPRPGGRGR